MTIKADQKFESKTEEEEPNHYNKSTLVDIINEYESDDEFELLDIQISKK